MFHNYIILDAVGPVNASLCYNAFVRLVILIQRIVCKEMNLSYVLAPGPEGYNVGIPGDLDKNAAYLAQLGYNGMELAFRNFRNVDPKAIFRSAEKHGLKIVNVLGAGRSLSEKGLVLSDPDADGRRKAVEAFNEILAFCGELGCGCVAGMCVGAYNKETFDADFDRLAGSLIKCGEYAASVGASVFVEPLDRHSPSLITKTSDAVRLIRAVDMDNVKLCLDSMHMFVEGEMTPECIDLAKGCIGHFHIADDDRKAPGLGTMDFKPILRALAAGGYDGFISPELSDKYDQAAAAVDSMEFFRKIYEE